MQRPVIINATGKGKDRVGFPSKECCHAAKLFLLKLAQKGMGIKGAKMLATRILTEEDVLGNKHRLIAVGSRAANQVPQMFGTEALSVLQGSHPLARLYVEKAHRKGHDGTIYTLHRSRREVWIIGERVLADAVH